MPDIGGGKTVKININCKPSKKPGTDGILPGLQIISGNDKIQFKGK
jgi:hypothetical protein